MAANAEGWERMIFALTIDQVLSGRKTCTTRRNEPLGIPGRTYAVQRGRGKKAEGRILIESIRYVERADDIDQATAEAEGFGSPGEFREVYAQLHGERTLEEGAWRIWFRLVKKERIKK